MALRFNLDKGSDQPVYRQIMDKIVAMTGTGDLAIGDQLPSSRELAISLGVNRSTVYRAYQELWALGYLESSPGSVTRIRKRAELVSADRRETSRIDWDSSLAPRLGDLQLPEGILPNPSGPSDNTGMATGSSATTVPDISGSSSLSGSSAFSSSVSVSSAASASPASGTSGLVDFTRLMPDPRHFPVEEYRRCLDTVLRRKGRELLGYGDPAGYGPLREYIAERLRLHEVQVGSDEILITTGAQGGLDLLLRAFLSPGDGVVFESPGYASAITMSRVHGARLLPVEMSEGGMDLQQLEALLSGGIAKSVATRAPEGAPEDGGVNTLVDTQVDTQERDKPKLVYTIPNFQNPTGITTDQRHREKLLDLCERYGVPLVEDGFEEELKYSGKAVLPIKSMDRSRLVIYLGTFSKILLPGIRSGWIAADRNLVKRLTELQRRTVLALPFHDQAALELFCRRGAYEQHIRRMHRLYRSRMELLLSQLKERLSGLPVRWTRPTGGYTVWLTLDREKREGSDEIEQTSRELSARLESSGVRLTAGGTSFIGNLQLSFRLSVGTVDAAEIVRGVERIEKVFSGFFSTPS